MPRSVHTVSSDPDPSVGTYDSEPDEIDSTPVMVLSQVFPARPSSFPDIEAFVTSCLAESPLGSESRGEVTSAVLDALLATAGSGSGIHVAFRIYPEGVEVDVLRAVEGEAELPSSVDPQATFSEWMGSVLAQRGMSQEAAARELGVSVRTVSRWLAGATEPRLRDLRRIRHLFGEVPL